MSAIKRQGLPLPDDERVITVCSRCGKACCWQGYFMCDSAATAGVVHMTVSELRVFSREHEDWWKTDEELAEGRDGMHP